MTENLEYWKRKAEAAEARVQEWREHCQKIHDEAYEIHGGTGKIIADLKAELDAIEARTIERCAQLVEGYGAAPWSSEPWDNIVAAIRALAKKPPTET